MTTLDDLSVVVHAGPRPDLLRRCLEAVARTSSEGTHHDLEVIAADDDPTSFAVRSGFVVHVAEHVELIDGWDLALLARFADPAVDVVGGRVIGPDGRIIQAGGLVASRGQARVVVPHGAGRRPDDPAVLAPRIVPVVSSQLWARRVGVAETGRVGRCVMEPAFQGVSHRPEAHGLDGDGATAERLAPLVGVDIEVTEAGLRHPLENTRSAPRIDVVPAAGAALRPVGMSPRVALLTAANDIRDLSDELHAQADPASMAGGLARSRSMLVHLLDPLPIQRAATTSVEGGAIARALGERADELVVITASDAGEVHARCRDLAHVTVVPAAQGVFDLIIHEHGGIGSPSIAELAAAIGSGGDLVVAVDSSFGADEATRIVAETSASGLQVRVLQGSGAHTAPQALAGPLRSRHGERQLRSAMGLDRPDLPVTVVLGHRPGPDAEVPSTLWPDDRAIATVAADRRADLVVRTVVSGSEELVVHKQRIRGRDERDHLEAGTTLRAESVPLAPGSSLLDRLLISQPAERAHLIETWRAVVHHPDRLDGALRCIDVCPQNIMLDDVGDARVIDEEWWRADYTADEVLARGVIVTVISMARSSAGVWRGSRARDVALLFGTQLGLDEDFLHEALEREGWFQAQVFLDDPSREDFARSAEAMTGWMTSGLEAALPA